MHAWCGCSSHVIAKAWHLLEQGDLRQGATKERFLWALYFLNVCPKNDEEGAGRCGGVDEKTHQKWVWYFVEELAHLEDEVVSAKDICAAC